MGCPSDRSTNSKVFSDLRLNPILALFRILHMMRIHSVSRICPLVTSLRLIYKPTWEMAHFSKSTLSEAATVHLFLCPQGSSRGSEGRSQFPWDPRPSQMCTNQGQSASMLLSLQNRSLSENILFSGYYNIFWVCSNYPATLACEDVQSSKYSDGFW